ncbi:MAG: hypothetical protein CVU98_09855 [Firmicutes bacterium HGW-Firmicutes-3]|jgi:hypothetical protein|nr:MAG: hypothetical protein CVU98_09855 [Firmicutes bacterium HGW-Firmicutes-3]
MNIKLKVLFVITLIYLTFGQVYGTTAEGILIDWSDKPYLIDKEGDGSKIDDLVKVSWYPDVVADKLYFRLTRSSLNSANRSWKAYIDINSEGNFFYIDIRSNPNSGKADIAIYNEAWVLLWKTTGYWCDSYNSELYIPMSYIANVSEAGYGFEIYVRTDSDKAPDVGPIIISTISTYPTITLFIVFIIVIAGSLSRRKGI